jgi:hypothetical protein
MVLRPKLLHSVTQLQRWLIFTLLFPTTYAIAETLKHIWLEGNSKPKRFANGLKVGKGIMQTSENVYWHVRVLAQADAPCAC